MLKKNDEYIVDIIDNGFQGEGIAKVDGITIFIDKAIRGEKIKIKIIKVMSNFCYGKILEIIEKSENRTTEDCTKYKKCGGCNLRHIDYKETLNIKKQTVQNCLYKSLKREIEVKDTIGMEVPIHYRNKLQYPVGLDVNNKPVMGVYSGRTHDIIETNNCYIQNETCQSIAKEMFEYIKKNNIKPYNEKTLKGTIRHIVIRIGVKTSEVLVTLVVNDNNLKREQEQELVKILTSKYKEIKTIVKNTNNKNTNVIPGDKEEIIYGDGYIHDMIRRI